MADWADEKAEQLLQWHDACEDSWYSCPQSMDGCADDSAGEECRCGLNERRAATAAALREAREPLEKEIAALRKQLADARKEASFVAFYEGRLEEERANAEQAYEHGREQGAREERERHEDPARARQDRAAPAARASDAQAGHTAGSCVQGW